MKKILLFTFIGPAVGSILFFIISLIGVLVFAPDSRALSLREELSLFPLFLIFGYAFAIIPAIFVGIFAIFLKYKDPWTNYTLLILSSFVICIIFFFNDRPNDYIFPSTLGILTTMVLGYFIFLKVKKDSLSATAVTASKERDDERQ